MCMTGIPMGKLCAFLEVSAKSPQKKLNMFLRWMIRRDSRVDFGIWDSSTIERSDRSFRYTCLPGSSLF